MPTPNTASLCPFNSLSVISGEYLPGNPKFATDSQAVCTDTTDGPVDVDAPDIVYSAEDDQTIEDYNRNHVQTAWHSVSHHQPSDAVMTLVASYSLEPVP